MPKTETTPHLYNAFGDIGIDVYGDQDAIVEVFEPGDDGFGPRLDAEFRADAKRLRDLIAGARWALEQMGEGEDA